MSDTVHAGGPQVIDWFDLPPVAQASGRTAGLSVALWRLDRDERYAVNSRLSFDHHLVCAHLAGRMQFSADLADRRYDLHCLPGTFTVGRPGERVDLEFRDAHATFVHFYLPTDWLASCLHEFAPRKSPDSFEILDAINSGGTRVVEFARMAVQAMRTGPTAKMEIEGAALLLAAALIRNHSNASYREIPRQNFPDGN